MLDRLHASFKPEGTGVFKPFRFKCRAGKLEAVPIADSSEAPVEYTVTVADEAHHLFAEGSDGGRAVESYVGDSTRLVVLSDSSQCVSRTAAMQLPALRAGFKTVRLTQVVRCTQRVVLGAMAFQTWDGDSQQAIDCCHDSAGLPLKPILFRRVTD